MESRGGGLFPSSPPPPPPPPPPPGTASAPPPPQSAPTSSKEELPSISPPSSPTPSSPTLSSLPLPQVVISLPLVEEKKENGVVEKKENGIVEKKENGVVENVEKKEKESGPPQIAIQQSMKEDEKKESRSLLQPVAQRSPSGRWNRYDTRLGVGSFKQVFLGLDAQEAKEVAWNTIKLDCLTANDKARVQAEVALLTRLKHKNILVMYDTWIDEETQELYLITSRMANTLKEHVAKLHPLQPQVIKKFCRQILSALVYLHQGVADTANGDKKPIIHRDLKCDNIFIDGPTGDVKVGDFGLAEFFDRGVGEDGKPIPGTMEGTLGFIAPELLQEQPYTERVDVYAFGMCVLEMATNEYPFSECGNKFLSLLQKSAQNLQPEALQKVTDPDLRKFIEQCLLPAEQRPSAKELLENTYYPLTEEGTISAPPSLEVEARLSTSLDMMLRIALKVGVNGVKKTIQFDYDISKDTPTSLAREIQADVLKDQQFADLEADIVAKLTEAVKPAIKKLRLRQLTELLQKLELEMSLMDLFAKEEITIVDLPLLQEADWDRLGVPLGPRRRLQQYLSIAPPPSPAGLNQARGGSGSFNGNNAGPGLSVGTSSPLGSPANVAHTLPPSSPTLSSSPSGTHLPSMSALPKPGLPPATPTAIRKAPAPPLASPEDEIAGRLANTSISGPPPGPPPPPKKTT